MKQTSMTALVSAFARAFHSQLDTEKVFDDTLARELLLDNEYQAIAKNMAQGITFFCPSFSGTEQEALRYVVDKHLAPSPLGRAAFAESALQNAMLLGAKQYIIYAAGYDSFAYRQPEWAQKLQIYQLDLPNMIEDMENRIQKLKWKKPGNLHMLKIEQNDWAYQLLRHPSFDQNAVSFCSLLGFSYYVSKEDFISIMDSLSQIMPKGSSIVFDYPDEKTHSHAAGGRVEKQVALAKDADEAMLAGYAYQEMEQLLAKSHFLAYEHVEPDAITANFFSKYNQANPEHPLKALEHVNYCLAVRQ